MHRWSELLGAALLAAAVAGCTEPEVRVCSTGLICPGAKVCDLQGLTCVDPTGLLVAQGEIQLGTIACGTESSETITVSNLGDEPVEFEASSTFAFVRLDPEVATVPAGGSVEVTATVDAANASATVGEMPGAFTFETADQLITRPATVEIAGASVSLSATNVDFGFSALDSPRVPKSVTVRNDGNASVEVNLGSLASPFALSDSGPFTVAGGATREIEVSYAPTLVGNYQDELELSFIGPVCQSDQRQVTVKGVVTDDALLVDTGTLDFGVSGCGVAAESQDLVITNKAVAGQTISFAITGAVEAYELPGGIALGPDESGVVTVTRSAVGRPTTPGDRPAKMVISAQPVGVSVMIDLVHRVDGAFLVADPGTVDFGTVAQGIGAFERFKVSNDGNTSGVVAIDPDMRTLGNDGEIVPNATQFSLGAGKENSNTMSVFSGTSAQPDRSYDFAIDSTNNCNATFVLEVLVGVQ